MPDRARIVAVCGEHSNAGKTQLAEVLIPLLGRCAAVKCKNTGEAPPRTIIEESPDEAPGKDTSRFLRAGARRAYLVQAGPEAARQIIEQIVTSGQFDTVLVEGNSAVDALQADLALFVQGDGPARDDSALHAARCQWIVRSNRERPPEGSHPAGEDSRAEVLGACRDGRLPCAEAFEIASRLGVAPGKVGAAAQQAGVKITRCQLGCF